MIEWRSDGGADDRLRERLCCPKLNPEAGGLEQ
jgi:hypothetical protein